MAEVAGAGALIPGIDVVAGPVALLAGSVNVGAEIYLAERHPTFANIARAAIDGGLVIGGEVAVELAPEGEKFMTNATVYSVSVTIDHTLDARGDVQRTAVITLTHIISVKGP